MIILCKTTFLYSCVLILVKRRSKYFVQLNVARLYCMLFITFAVKEYVKYIFDIACSKILNFEMAELSRIFPRSCRQAVDFTKKIE